MAEDDALPEVVTSARPDRRQAAMTEIIALRSSLRLLKWMLGFNIAMNILIVGKLFVS